MRAWMRWAAGLALALSGFAQVEAQAATYPSVYVFGDSLVDSGNAFLATGGAQASPTNGYFAGRFSNGYNFADYMSIAYTGAPSVPVLANGPNAAVGGALAQTKTGETSPSFLAQVATFTSLGKTIPLDALVLVTFGGNDVRATALTGGAVDFSGAAADFGAGLSALYNLGARNFVITGAPDIGLLPSAQPLAAIPGRLAELTARSAQISNLLSIQGNVIDARAGTSVFYFDLFTYEHNLLNNPAAFGLPANLNSTTPCQILGGGSPQIANCTNSLYFDGIHPTTQIHQVIANAIVAQVNSVPEPATWLMMIGGFGMIGGALRRRATVRFATA